MDKRIEIFFSYARKDQALRDRLEDHLSLLKYRGLITTWDTQHIVAGQEALEQIQWHLDSAEMILLLISARFLADEQCMGTEMTRALERHELEGASVVPVLLRPVHLTGAPFAHLHPLPPNQKPVTQWKDREMAFLKIVREIEKLVQQLLRLQQGPSFHMVLPSHELADEAPIYSSANSWESSPENFFAEYLEDLESLERWMGPIYSKEEALRFRKAYYQASLAAYGGVWKEYRQALRWGGEIEEILQKIPRKQWLDPEGIARALTGLTRYEEAIDTYQRALALWPKSATYRGLGDTYLQSERYPEAVTAYTQALQMDPTAACAYEGLYEAFKQQGKIHEAEDIAQQAAAQGYMVNYDAE